ncbi:MAG: VWA domain-containing protein [Bryobacteraceae bacterium]
MSKTGAVFVLLSMALPILGQEPVVTFRSEVSLIKVDAKVSMPAGRSIPALTKEDFLIFDEDAPQTISHFASEVEPLDLLLLLDVSNSMTRSLSAMAGKTREALAQLHTGDRVALMLFSTRAEVTQPLTDDFHQLQTQILGSIYKQSLGSGTLVNEALVMAAHYLQSEAPRGRRSILIVTDNQSARAAATSEQVLRALSDANTTLNALVTGGPPVPPAAPPRYTDPSNKAPDVLEYVSRTGGEVLTGDSPAASFRKIVESILTRYTLDYAGPAAEPGSYRRIRVELSPNAKARYPGAKVEARAGYYTAK